MAESPSKIQSHIRITGKDTLKGEIYTHWENDEYYGCLRTLQKKEGGIVHVLSITALDNSAKHDWRDFQQLKNMLIGEEWEAVELYPAESRLVDPTNRFYLWCAPKGTFTFGFNYGRNITEMNMDGMNLQRPFPVRGEGQSEQERGE